MSLPSRVKIMSYLSPHTFHLNSTKPNQISHTPSLPPLLNQNSTTSRLNNIPHHVTFSLPLLTFFFFFFPFFSFIYNSHSFCWLTYSRLYIFNQSKIFSSFFFFFLFLELLLPMCAKSYISTVFLLAFEFILPMCTPSSMWTLEHSHPEL